MSRRLPKSVGQPAAFGLFPKVQGKYLALSSFPLSLDSSNCELKTFPFYREKFASRHFLQYQLHRQTVTSGFGPLDVSRLDRALTLRTVPIRVSTHMPVFAFHQEQSTCPKTATDLCNPPSPNCNSTQPSATPGTGGGGPRTPREQQPGTLRANSFCISA